jgi:hypothetical protein
MQTHPHLQTPPIWIQHPLALRLLSSAYIGITLVHTTASSGNVSLLTYELPANIGRKEQEQGRRKDHRLQHSDHSN